MPQPEKIEKVAKAYNQIAADLGAGAGRSSVYTLLLASENCTGYKRGCEIPIYIAIAGIGCT